MRIPPIHIDNLTGSMSGDFIGQQKYSHICNFS